MAKTKFILTPDLVKVEPEPLPSDVSALQLIREAEAPKPQLETKDPAYPQSANYEPSTMRDIYSQSQKSHGNSGGGVLPQRQNEPILHVPTSHNSSPAYESSLPQQTLSRQQPLHQGESPSIYASVPMEPDPMTNPYANPYYTKRDMVIRDQFNLKIDRALKMEFRIWCLRHGISMTDALEEALREFMQKSQSV